MKKLTKDHSFYAFGPNLTPALTIESDETIMLETHDCFEGQLKSENDTLDTLDWDHINPATGPVYIQNAEPGDILKVQLLDVKPVDYAKLAVIPGEGALGDWLDQPDVAFLKNGETELTLKNRYHLQPKPMIGVIGVAPADRSIPNGTPDNHGGNMDCKEIGSGTTLYFKVNVPGALLGAGDVHSVMGDGEVLICGAETPAEITLTATVIKANTLADLPTPFFETDQVYALISAAPSLDQAVKNVNRGMLDFLTKTVGLPANDAGMLMTTVGDLKFCQIVDPQVTVRFEFPKYVLADIGFTL
ncbi:MAG: acetamidase/formamidase family protein [Bifidobacteriaceae bacterium]|jgi:amidase|nr:acetamidase/formamidase family protein [Bifidobacteriaceae bacterium]